MEAFGLYKYHTATGVVQWMLSNPWPSLIWHTYDYYLYPAGTYFGMKKSMETLHVQYSYPSRDVYINNTLLNSFSNLTVKADLYDEAGNKKMQPGNRRASIGIGCRKKQILWIGRKPNGFIRHSRLILILPH